MPGSVGLTGLSSLGVPQRWVVVRVGWCSSCISSPFCAGRCLRLPQQVLLCLWHMGDALHSCSRASGI